MPFRPGTKCFLFAWVPAWGASIFLTSGLLAALGLAPDADCGLACTLAVADAVSPQAKLAFGALLGALMWLARRTRPANTAALTTRDLAAGTAAIVLVLGLLPAAWSRGLGIGLFEVRFAPLPTLIYIIGAAMGAGLGTLLERSCRRQLIEA